MTNNPPKVYRTRRRVLQRCPVDDEIDDLAQSYGWPVVYDADRDFDRGRGREVNWGVTSDSVLGYLESHISNDCCLVGVGKDPGQAEEIIARVEADLAGEIESVDGLLAVLQDEDDPRLLARGLVRAGFGAPREFDRVFFDAFAAAACHHPVYQVRDIAISSMVYIEWPEFAPLLERIKAEEPDEQVRARATMVHSAYQAAGLS
ncbi:MULTISPECIES: hypothetical protein [unclassified Kribbella]|uniref:hypothetical protein n=1 Tax=unclassified Kribbella TaxID=2644121 RepID=UPI003016DD68